jgi:hypothetical protein
MTRTCEGQLSLDAALYPTHEHTTGYWVDWCVEWLVDVRGCTDAVVPYVRRLYEEFERGEAFDRASALIDLNGDGRRGDWSLADVDVLGVYDHTVDYHVCWDRAWAAEKGLARDRVRHLVEWDYSKDGPVFDDEIYSGE